MRVRQLHNVGYCLLTMTLAWSIGTTGCRAIDERKTIMNEHMGLYSWVRDKDSILLARIAEVQTQNAAPGQEKVRLRLKIEETLWGSTGAQLRQCEFERPVSEISRLKFPDPLWGRVTVQQGTLLLLVAPEQSETVLIPIYAEDVRKPNDTVLASLRMVLQAEKSKSSTEERVRRYLRWLAENSTVPKLFGAQTLAQDPDLGEARTRIDVINAFTNVFSSRSNLFVRLSVGTWLCEDIYPASSGAGRTAILNALIRGLSDATEDIRRFSFDNFVNIPPDELQRANVTKSPDAVRFLRAAIEEETSPEARAQIQRLIDVLSK